MPSKKIVAIEDVVKHFHLPIDDVAKKLGVCATVLKKTCRRHGIPRWPHRKVKSMDNVISVLESKLDTVSPSEKERLVSEIESLQKKKAALLNPKTTVENKKRDSRENSSKFGEEDGRDGEYDASADLDRIYREYLGGRPPRADNDSPSPRGYTADTDGPSLASSHRDHGSIPSASTSRLSPFTTTPPTRRANRLSPDVITPLPLRPGERPPRSPLRGLPPRYGNPICPTPPPAPALGPPPAPESRAPLSAQMEAELKWQHRRLSLPAITPSIAEAADIARRNVLKRKLETVQAEQHEAESSRAPTDRRRESIELVPGLDIRIPYYDGSASYDRSRPPVPSCSDVDRLRPPVDSLSLDSRRPSLSLESRRLSIDASHLEARRPSLDYSSLAGPSGSGSGSAAEARRPSVDYSMNDARRPPMCARRPSVDHEARRPSVDFPAMHELPPRRPSVDVPHEHGPHSVDLRAVDCRRPSLDYGSNCHSRHPSMEMSGGLDHRRSSIESWVSFLDLRRPSIDSLAGFDAATRRQSVESLDNRRSSLETVVSLDERRSSVEGLPPHVLYGPNRDFFAHLGLVQPRPLHMADGRRKTFGGFSADTGASSPLVGGPSRPNQEKDISDTADLRLPEIHIDDGSDSEDDQAVKRHRVGPSGDLGAPLRPLEPQVHLS